MFCGFVFLYIIVSIIDGLHEKHLLEASSDSPNHPNNLATETMLSIAYRSHLRCLLHHV